MSDARSMNQPTPPADLQTGLIRSAFVTVPCDELQPMLDFFVGQLRFRVDAIFPADAPSRALISGYGLNLYLTRGSGQGPAMLRLLCDAPEQVAGGRTELVAPNGMTIGLVHADPPMVVPPTRQQLVLTPSHGDSRWGVGRAGMQYRDLLPERHGGGFIASHIRLLKGGPVPDYVHFHKIRFQLIFCRSGWVRVVYEGQGEPFILEAGDCVLQPPLIRHRVLESSAGASVVEIGAPASHITMADHTMTLPSAPLASDHSFSGQRFVRSLAAQAHWKPWVVPGFEARDTGIAEATDGLATVRVVRAASRGANGSSTPTTAPNERALSDSGIPQALRGEFCFHFVLSGRMQVHTNDASYNLDPDDSITLPDGLPYRLSASDDLSFLEVVLPADGVQRAH